MTKWEVVARLGTLAALALAAYSLYLQKKRPKLHVQLENTTDMLGPTTPDGFGGAIPSEVAVIVIHARNRTDKPITVDSIKFQRKHDTVVVPLSRTISTVPPHEKRHAIVIVPDFRSELGADNKGYFVIIDVLGYKHKSKSITIS